MLNVQKSVGQRLALLRSAAMLSQKEVATKAGMSEYDIWRMENGFGFIDDANQARDISHALGVTEQPWRVWVDEIPLSELLSPGKDGPPVHDDAEELLAALSKRAGWDW